MRIRSKPWAKPELDACGFCVKDPESLRGKWQDEFKNGKPIYLELGCGKGGFISKAASGNRNNNFIAVDIKNEMLVLAKRKIEAEYEKKKLPFDNVRIFIKNIEQIDNIFTKEDKIERIYINFCNPWPKSKHKKRRLTHYRQLVKYKEFLSGELWFKTDDDALFRESFEYFERAGYKIKYKTYDLHKSGFEENIITEHEQMFTAEGKKIKFLIAELQKQNEIREGEFMGDLHKELIVDGNTADMKNTFKGVGAAAGRNSIQRLMDYKAGYPDSYKNIMDILFKPYYGAGISYIKAEGNDNQEFLHDAEKINSDMITGDINEAAVLNNSSDTVLDITNSIIKKLCQPDAEPCHYDLDDLIKAEQPWSGYYEVSDGLWGAAHITHFIGNDWKQIKSFDTGSEKEVHAAFMSDKGDYTLIFENSSDSDILYNINISVLNIDKADSVLYCVESVKNEESGKYEWFRVIDRIIPDSSKNGSSYRIDVKAGSILTCTTIGVEDVDGVNSVKSSSYSPAHLELPYTDSFDHNNEPGNKIPLYTAGILGKYELKKFDNENVLEHIADTDNFEGAVLCIGDKYWSNYSARVEVMLENAFDGGYAGIGIRCKKNDDNTYTSGCELRIYSYGKWQLRCLDEVAAEGTDGSIDASEWNRLKISVNRDVVICTLNKQVICNYKMSEPLSVSGFVSLNSSAHSSRFRKLSVDTISGAPCFCAFSDISGDLAEYGDEWTKNKNSIDTEIKNAVIEFRFVGGSAALIGKSENLRLKVEIDDKISAAGFSIEKSAAGQVFYYVSGLHDGEHKVKVTVLSGKLSFEGITVDEKKRISENKPKRIRRSIDIELPRKNIVNNKLMLGIGLAAAGIGIIILRKIFRKKGK